MQSRTILIFKMFNHKVGKKKFLQNHKSAPVIVIRLSSESFIEML